VVAISAFNHPLNLIVHQVVPAIAVGCPVIVKPASATPLSCLDFVRLVHEAGLPEPLVPNAHRERRPCRAACDRSTCRLPELSSARRGWAGRCPQARARDRSALEHGGVAPAIVDRSADLDRIIETDGQGGYYHAGQVCVSTQRIFVHADIEAEFLDRFTTRVGPCASATLVVLRQRSDR
jgi:acyl-CoA reductase-like NAD-dependent aldehyde dehydrogenase